MASQSSLQGTDPFSTPDVSYGMNASQPWEFKAWEPPRPDMPQPQPLDAFRHYNSTSQQFSAEPSHYMVQHEEAIQRFTTEAPPTVGSTHSSTMRQAFGNIPVPGSNIGVAPQPAPPASSPDLQYSNYSSHYSHAYSASGFPASNPDVSTPIVVVSPASNDDNTIQQFTEPAIDHDPAPPTQAIPAMHDAPLVGTGNPFDYDPAPLTQAVPATHDTPLEGTGDLLDHPPIQPAGTGLVDDTTPRASTPASRTNPFASRDFSLSDILGGEYYYHVQSLTSYMTAAGVALSEGRMTPTEHQKVQDRTLKRFIGFSLKSLLTGMICAGKRLTSEEARLMCIDYIGSFDIFCMFAVSNHIDVRGVFADSPDSDIDWARLYSPAEAARIQINVVNAVLVEVLEWWDEKVVQIFELCKKLIDEPRLFPDLAVFRRLRLAQPLLLALHRHAAAGSYLHNYRLRGILLYPGGCPMFLEHMDSLGTWIAAIALSHNSTNKYEYDLLRHGALLLTVVGIINIFCEDLDSRVAMTRYAFEKMPMCNAKPASEPGQQWSAIFAPASGFLSATLSAIETDGFDIKMGTLLSMNDLFLTKQKCTDEYITKCCLQGTLKEKVDMVWINQFARNQVAQALHPTKRVSSVVSNLAVTFGPADPAAMPRRIYPGVQPIGFSVNFQGLRMEEAIAHYGAELVDTYIEGIQLGKTHHKRSMAAIPARIRECLFRSTASGTEAIAKEAFANMVRANTNRAIGGLAVSRRHTVPVAYKSNPVLHYSVPNTGTTTDSDRESEDGGSDVSMEDHSVPQFLEGSSSNPL